MVDDSPLIVAEALAARLGDAALRVIDCRFDLGHPHAGHSAWLAGHIPGAVYADLDADLSGTVDEASGRHPLPPIDAAAATFSRLGVDQETDVVVYDADSGAIAARAWWLLRWLGHDRVQLLERGLTGWLAEGYALEAGPTRVEPRHFVPQPRDDMTLTTDDVAAALAGSRELVLVDARDAPRYRGETEPIDAVAGHIPGALNLPFSENLNADGRFRRAGALRRMWNETLHEAQKGELAVMCGSGVTACHHAISAILAGLPEPRLYVGSWSEWIRAAERPVATGPRPDGGPIDAEPA